MAIDETANRAAAKRKATFSLPSSPPPSSKPFSSSEHFIFDINSLSYDSDEENLWDDEERRNTWEPPNPEFVGTRRGRTGPQDEVTSMRQLIEGIPLDEDAPVGVRKRRLFKKKDLDDHDGEDDEPEMTLEEEIETDRKRVENAARLLGCKRQIVKVHRREEIVDVKDEDEKEDVDDEVLRRPGDAPPKRKRVKADDIDEDETISGAQIGQVRDTRRYRSVVEEQIRWRIGGMKTPLLDHQILGVKWMYEREVDGKRPHGGLVSDAMGLGKTIQSIATMVKNFAPSSEPDDPHVTLIVAPVALLQQWKEEIKMHVKPGAFKIFIHHGEDRLKTVRELKKWDVVICSYAAIMYSCPPVKPPKGTPRMTNDELEMWFEDNFEERRGIFHRVQYWRVILDESHVIRNKGSRTSIACRRLEAVNTWCLTGTPIFNKIEDIFPVFDFVQHPQACNWPMFKALIKCSEIEAGRRVQAVLRGCNMRRVKDEMLMGKPLISLPKRRTRLVQLEFEPHERELYDSIESQCRVKVNRIISGGCQVKPKDYTCILVLLLRLRQICDHPWLILETINNDLDVKTLELTLSSIPDTPKNAVFREILQAARERAALPVTGECSGEDCTIPLDANTEVVTRCGHTFCRGCIADTEECPVCRRPTEIIEKDDDPLLSTTGDGGIKPRIKGPPPEFIHSTKTVALEQQILAWQKEFPGRKIILFSQFVTYIDLIEHVISEFDQEYVVYTGQMSMVEREEALARFRTDGACGIMLMSIKAGGVGLNLTVANLVVSMDLWWNAAVELQAFARVHRLGQNHEVEVVRFLVNETVEQRMLGLQQHKIAVANAAMGEGEMNLGKLTMQELVGLFGRVVHDEDGRMMVVGRNGRA